jgi:predicted Zn-dependent protease
MSIMKNIHIVYSEKYPAHYSAAAIGGIGDMAKLAQIEYKVSLVETNDINTKAINDFFYNKRNGKYNERLFCIEALPAIYKWLGLKADENSPLIYLLEGDLYFYAGKGLPYCSWIFGAASVYGGIETPFRIEKMFKAEPDSVKAEIFKTVVMHEIGHTLGLVSTSAPNHTRSKNPIFRRHCRHGYCLMSQNVLIPGFKKKTDIRLSRESPLCPDCLDYLISYNKGER